MSGSESIFVIGNSKYPFSLWTTFGLWIKNFRHIYSEFMIWLNSYKKYTKYYFSD